MKPVVVDASVVAAAFFPEASSKAARQLFGAGRELRAPDLVFAEVANVIWKRRNRGDIEDEEAANLLSDVMGLPLEITPSEQLVVAALGLAMRSGRTVYDCLYLALAIQTKAIMISNDRRFVNALAVGPLKDHVIWLGSTV